MKLKWKESGRISFFGGIDSGMSFKEDLSLYWKHSQCDKRPDLFNPRSSNPDEGTSHRLKECAFYIAVRFPVKQKEKLRDSIWKVTNPVNGKYCLCSLVDWGPALWTKRIADLSWEVGKVLGVKTNDKVEVELL